MDNKSQNLADELASKMNIQVGVGSDNSRTFANYQKTAHDWQVPGSKEDHIDNWAIGLAEETGEVLGLIKHDRFRKEPLDPIQLAKELGDVLWYVAALATEYNLNLDAIAALNIAKLQHRFGGMNFTYDGSHDRHNKELALEDTEQYKTIVADMQLPQGVSKLEG